MSGLRTYIRLYLELLRMCLRRERGVTVLVLTCMGAGAMMFALLGLAVKVFVDGIVDGDARKAALGGALAALAYTLDLTVSGIANSMRIHLIEKVGHTEVESAIMKTAAGLPEVDHLELPEYLDRMTALKGKAWAVVFSFTMLVQAGAMILRLVLALVLLGGVSPWLFLMLPCVAVQLWLERRGRARQRRADLALGEDRRVQDHLFGLCTTAAAGKEIRAAGAAPKILRRLGAASMRARRLRLRGQLSTAVWGAAGWCVFAVGYTIAIGLVAVQVRDGGATSGDVMLAATVGAMLREVVNRAVSAATGATGSVRVLEPYLWLRGYAAEHMGSDAARPAPARLAQGIRLRSLSYTYRGASRPAVDDVTVDLPAGSVVAVVGEYGSGKTTLTKLLAKLHRPTEGVITVDGMDLAAVDTEDWRRSMSAVFQDFGRYQTSFAEAVSIGNLEDDSPAALDAAVTAADADGLRSRLPDGDRTQLGSQFGGVELSEGQWQKVALARSCMRSQPLLFLLDEPTASLDAPSEQAVFESYMARSRKFAAESGAVTLIVSHRFSTVAGADLILVMQDGRLAESGSHEELVAAGGVYAELYGIHADSYAEAPSGA